MRRDAGVESQQRKWQVVARQGCAVAERAGDQERAAHAGAVGCPIAQCGDPFLESVLGVHPVPTNPAARSGNSDSKAGRAIEQRPADLRVSDSNAGSQQEDSTKRRGGDREAAAQHSPEVCGSRGSSARAVGCVGGPLVDFVEPVIEHGRGGDHELPRMMNRKLSHVHANLRRIGQVEDYLVSC